MKKLLTIVTIFVTSLLQGCDDSSNYKSNEEINHLFDEYGEKYYIATIDSCEYIKNISNGSMSHKGNCKFCKQRLNK